MGVVLEYGGRGRRISLSVPERATIANMGAEMGVTTSIFPSDEVTRGFLKARGASRTGSRSRPTRMPTMTASSSSTSAAWSPWRACPTAPATSRRSRELAGTNVDQVCIGSCTNTLYRTCVTVAAILKGRTGPPRT